MKTITCLSGLFLVAVSCLSGQTGFNGTWEASEVAFAPWTFVLAVDGAKLTGSVSMAGTSPVAVSAGTVEANRISFRCDSPDHVRTIFFTGVMEGDAITFTREVKVQPGGSPGMDGVFGAAGAAKFTAKRVAVSALSIVMLGTGTPNTDPDRSGPAVAVVAGTEAYLVDAGPGVVRRAKAASDRTQLNALRAISLTHLFLTHLHSDHTLGYPDLIFSPAVLGRGKPLEVFGPKGTQDMTDHLMAAWKKDMDVRINGLEHGNAAAYKVNVHEIAPGVVYRDANVTVKAFFVTHATWDEAFGYRFEAGGRSVVISGDMAPNPNIVEACRGCDVLVHEVYCNVPGREASPYYKAAHTSTTELAAIANQAKPKLLVLYHQLFSGCDEATLLQQVRKAYAGAVVSAKDFDIY